MKIEIEVTTLEHLLAALQEVKQGAIKINRQDSRITNYSLRRVDEALKITLDRICQENTAFKTFEELLTAKGDYRPSIPMGKPWGSVLANAYDEAQEARGDYRRAYRS